VGRENKKRRNRGFDTASNAEPGIC